MMDLRSEKVFRALALFKNPDIGCVREQQSEIVSGWMVIAGFETMRAQIKCFL